jgi:glycosyltransferase involved in cell wall biosynthesis
MIEKPKLSILIPAYNYSGGIDSILEKFSYVNSDPIEIIIYDDSTTNEVHDVVYKWISFGLSISYKRNILKKGPIGNWNSLLNAAKGEYCILMHHDELPQNPNFVSDLILYLADNRFDVLVLRCQLINARKSFTLSRTHMPIFFQKFVMNFCSSYLFLHNVLGPTSVLVVRREFYPKFDSKLKWLVDVDLYFRLRAATQEWYWNEKLAIGSILNRSDSITKKIRKNLTTIIRSEQKYIYKKYKSKNLKLLFSKFLIIPDLISWSVLRLIFIIPSFFTSFQSYIFKKNEKK